MLLRFSIGSCHANMHIAVLEHHLLEIYDDAKGCWPIATVKPEQIPKLHAYSNRR